LTATAQQDQVQRLAEKLRRWEDERFYGEQKFGTTLAKQKLLWYYIVSMLLRCKITMR